MCNEVLTAKYPAQAAKERHDRVVRNEGGHYALDYMMHRIGWVLKADAFARETQSKGI